MKANSNRETGTVLMFIKSIKVTNYKSLKQCEVQFSKRISVFVGPNGAGKSNLFDALEFVGDVFQNGLNRAVKERNGFYQICYKHNVPAEYIGFTVTSDYGEDFELKYTFRFSVVPQVVPYEIRIDEDELQIRSIDGFKQITVNRQNGKLSVARTGIDQSSDPKLNELLNEIEGFSKFAKLRTDELLLTTLSTVTDFFEKMMRDLFGRTSMVQINPMTCRKAGDPSAAQLGKHGEHLPTVLYMIKSRFPTTYEMILESMKMVNPRLRDIELEHRENDNEIVLSIVEEQEKYAWKPEEISDGTIQLLGMLTAIASPGQHVLMVEEPENHVHPRLVEILYRFCEKVAARKQLLLTTHSVTLLNLLGDEAEVFIVYRDGQQTRIHSLAAFEEAQDALEYELTGDFFLNGYIREYLPWYVRGVPDEQ